MKSTMYETKDSLDGFNSRIEMEEGKVSISTSITSKLSSLSQNLKELVAVAGRVRGGGGGR